MTTVFFYYNCNYMFNDCVVAKEIVVPRGIMVLQL
jgi:hypothetical protein